MALTQKDLAEIKQIIDEGLEIKLEEKLEEKLEAKLEEKLKHFPTKEEFFSKMDEVIGELKAMREEMTLISHRVSNHEDRIETLEEIHPGGRHSS